MSRRLGRFQFPNQSLVLSAMKRNVRIAKRALFLPSRLAMKQIRDLWQAEALIEYHQVRFDLAAAHQVNPRKQHAINVKQRLNPWRRLLCKELPLSRRKPKVVMRVVTGNAPPANLLEPFMLR
jgi:hypothetical protein